MDKSVRKMGLNIFNRKMVARQRSIAIKYKQVFGGERGRDVLTDLMNQFHVLNEHEGTGFEEGQRSVVLYIMKTVGISAERFKELFDGAMNGNHSN